MKPPGDKGYEHYNDLEGGSHYDPPWARCPSCNEEVKPPTVIVYGMTKQVIVTCNCGATLRMSPVYEIIGFKVEVCDE